MEDFLIEYKNGHFKNAKIKIKSDDISPWISSDGIDRKQNFYKVFNGFCTDYFEKKFEILDFWLKCELTKIHFNKDFANPDIKDINY